MPQGQKVKLNCCGCEHTRTHTHTHTRTHAHTHTYAHVHTHTRTHARSHAHTHISDGSPKKYIPKIQLRLPHFPIKNTKLQSSQLRFACTKLILFFTFQDLYFLA